MPLGLFRQSLSQTSLFQEVDESLRRRFSATEPGLYIMLEEHPVIAGLALVIGALPFHAKLGKVLGQRRRSGQYGKAARDGHRR